MRLKNILPALDDIGKLIVGAVIGGVVTVYFVQGRANQFARETEASNRAYSQRQEAMASVIPILENCKHALDSLPDHDSLMSMPLDTIRFEIVKASKKEGQALDVIEANSTLFEIKLENSFGKDVAEALASIEVQLHGLVDARTYFAFSRKIRTKEQFLDSDEAYDGVVKITQETEELSEAISDVERRLLITDQS